MKEKGVDEKEEEDGNGRVKTSRGSHRRPVVMFYRNGGLGLAARAAREKTSIISNPNPTAKDPRQGDE